MSNVKTPEEAFAAMLAAVPESLRQGFAEYVKARAVVVTEDPRAAGLRTAGVPEAFIPGILAQMDAEKAAPVKPSPKTVLVPQTLTVAEKADLLLSRNDKSGDVLLTVKPIGAWKSGVAVPVVKKGEPVTVEAVERAQVALVKKCENLTAGARATGFKLG